MAISRMKKVLIAGHGPERDAFIGELQSASVLHPVPLPERGPQPPGDAGFRGEVALMLRRLTDAKRFLDRHKPEVPLLKRLAAPARSVTAAGFNEVLRDINPGELLGRAEDLEERISRLEARREALTAENRRLEPWRDLVVNPADIGRSDAAQILLGVADNGRLARIGDFEHADCQVLRKMKNESVLLLALHAGGRDIDEIRTAAGFKELELPDLDTSPRERYEANRHELGTLAGEMRAARGAATLLLDDFDALLVLLEHFTNMERRDRALEGWLTLGNSFILCGWIREEDAGALDALVSRFDSLVVEEIPPGEGESPPVAYRNPPIFSPFQLITRLYSNPTYDGIDPSPVVFPFFVIFFALALTDAGYGLVMVMLAALALAKVRGNRDIIFILLWGGVATVITGLLTGGIFGDLLRGRDPFLEVPLLTGLRERLIWFDPMVEPMVFFRLVLALGVMHVITGLSLGFIYDIRHGRIVDAIADRGTWIVIVVSLLTVLFSSEMCVRMSLVSSGPPPVPETFRVPALAAFGAAGAAVVFLGGRGEKSIFFRFFIGFLKLFVLSGVFSYLGDVLSYIRLMALGMVTAGIGMAINAIAFMMYDIPVAGVFLTLLVLIFGHIFNMAINILGAFVHTLRLQYVEFFPKFFTGGGRDFVPLANCERYVTIIE
ncbi:MAG: hypothetical protein JXA20_10260 [Spirochaetes bacterium]|nr:hypothetical protein [Spirochaetota bacterium]